MAHPPLNPVSVIGYESTLDAVPRAEGARNPAWYNTITGDNGGGLYSHNAPLYAATAEGGEQPVAGNNLDVFFANPKDSIVTNFYATKG